MEYSSSDEIQLEESADGSPRWITAPRSRIMSSPMYFGDTLTSKSHRMSSSTLSNKDKFFNLPTHASLSHLCPANGMSRCTSDCDLLHEYSPLTDPGQLLGYSS